MYFNLFITVLLALFLALYAIGCLFAFGIMYEREGDNKVHAPISTAFFCIALSFLSWGLVGMQMAERKD